jgi:hypothetical protein
VKDNTDDFGIADDDNVSLKDPARLKKQSSYTYWVQNNKEQFPQAQDKAIIQPRKIEDPELLKQLEQ